MQIIVSGHQFDVSDVTREYIEKKILKLKEHYSILDTVRVVLTQTHSSPEQFDVEISTHAVRGVDIAAEGHDPDLIKAFDQATDRADRQLKRFKEKLQDKRPK